MSEVQAPIDFDQYVDTWNAAREAREARRREPYSYLAYAALHKLGGLPQRFANIPGSWRTGPDGPTVDLEVDERLTVDGDAVAGSHSFAPLGERELRRAALAGDVVIELSKRGGQDLLRPIDPSFGQVVSAAYDHTPAYEPDLRWVIEGDFLPFGSLRPTEVDATVGEIVHTHPAIGELVFEIAGVHERLLVLARDGQQSGTAGTGFVTFTDATNRVTTDPLGRVLAVELPESRGLVTLDFNYTQNLQRPYTTFAPCPLPPAGNHLRVAIEAGDQLPVFRR